MRQATALFFTSFLLAGCEAYQKWPDRVARHNGQPPVPAATSTVVFSGHIFKQNVDSAAFRAAQRQLKHACLACAEPL